MKNMKFKILFIICLLIGFTSTSSFAQKEVRKQLREGNGYYKKKKFTNAELSYRKALKTNAHSGKALYNLGNALYRQKKIKEAASQYEAAVKSGTLKDPLLLSSAFHNLGNTFMHDKNYADAVQAYRQAMIYNPRNDNTRYNLALAQKLLKNSPPKNNDKNNKNKNKNKNKNDKNNKNNKNNQNKNKDKQNKQNQQQPQDNNQMSKQNAQQMLDALSQEEKGLHDRLNKNMSRQQKKSTDKQW